MERKHHIPGITSVIPDSRVIKFGVDNNRLSALVAALLDAAGGSVTLTREQVERVWDGPKINYLKLNDGSLKLTLEGRVQDGAE